MIFYIIIVLPSCTFGQDVSGIWNGKIYHSNDAYSKSWDFSLEFEQINNKLSGTGIINTDDQFAKFSFSGVVNKDVVTTGELVIFEQNSNKLTGGWCGISKMELNLINRRNLVGSWFSPRCSGGRIEIEKELTFFEGAEICMAEKLKDWQKKGKFEKTEDHRKRVSKFNEEKKIAELKKECVCEKIDWELAKNEYDADKEFFKVSLNSFTPFKIYVPINEAELFDENFKSLQYKNILCGFDFSNMSLKVESLEVINPINGKRYSTKSKKTPPIVENTVKSDDRTVLTKNQIEVSSKNLILQVWDNNKEDGDIISLKLNGEWILKNFRVKKSKNEIRLSLTKKDNLLVLHAENLGDQPPNTAAISINDGIKVQELILNSDEDQSEAIRISLK